MQPQWRDWWEIQIEASIGASKHAVVGITKAVTREEIESGTRVNAVAP
jgi:NAD(P)-dependent dehydrogenase (short-subunit alcohol dehydrogenase family)